MVWNVYRILEKREKKRLIYNKKEFQSKSFYFLERDENNFKLTYEINKKNASLLTLFAIH